MLKQMKFESKPVSSFHKHNRLLVKFAASFLLLGLAFRLFYSDSIGLSVEPPPLADHETEPSSVPSFPPQTPPPGPVDFPGNSSQASQNGYIYWRWKPRDCELSKFNPQRFLALMRNKSWAFVGDSISRNHVQSLICILSQVEQAVEVYHDKEYRSKRWHFPSYNFTLSVIWTPFLIGADIFEDMNGVSTSEIQLYLDKVDKTWTDQYNSFDYVVIGVGKWFLKTAIFHENNTVSGCHSCPGKNLTELGFEYSYRSALRAVFNFITRSDHKASVFFRTTTPDHFENGEWFSGGHCNRSVPFKEGEVDLKDVDNVMRTIELEEFEKAAAKGSEEGVNLKLLDTTHLSLLRSDGHPGPYRQFQPFAEDKNAKVQNDCLHWCLPGPIDTWNDLVMELLVNGDKYQ
ncbi:PREDICTED: protein trichome birefringence-like 25 isoform X2 [Prunus mume]|uniref:Protein trichome birefringence-like 25 isoform X2 n=1 Tax=Prunus mume TaxID=102107 RepID=A0ABM0P1V5_PRUMU|nr:PREDICTED: protein trichome birefringence-like 25 isoform X2 [Prunus mume]